MHRDRIRITNRILKCDFYQGSRFHAAPPDSVTPAYERASGTSRGYSVTAAVPPGHCAVAAPAAQRSAAVPTFSVGKVHLDSELKAIEERTTASTAPHRAPIAGRGNAAVPIFSVGKIGTWNSMHPTIPPRKGKFQSIFISIMNCRCMFSCQFFKISYLHF
jgi:hypothetical protein